MAEWREPGGREVKRRIGPAWTKRGRPDLGYFTKRTAEDWLRAILVELDALDGARFRAGSPRTTPGATLS